MLVASVTQSLKIVCYHQPIYDDICLEPIEYAGLGLSANPDDFFINPSSVLTIVKPIYHNCVIGIVDDDSKFYFVQYVSCIAKGNTILDVHAYNVCI